MDKRRAGISAEEAAKMQKKLARLGKQIYRKQARHIAEFTLEKYFSNIDKIQQEAMEDIRYQLKASGASTKKVDAALKKVEQGWEKDKKALSRKWLSPRNIAQIAESIRPRY